MNMHYEHLCVDDSLKNESNNDYILDNNLIVSFMSIPPLLPGTDPLHTSC